MINLEINFKIQKGIEVLFFQGLFILKLNI